MSSRPTILRRGDGRFLLRGAGLLLDARLRDDRWSLGIGLAASSPGFASVSSSGEPRPLLELAIGDESGSASPSPGREVAPPPSPLAAISSPIERQPVFQECHLHQPNADEFQLLMVGQGSKRHWSAAVRLTERSLRIELAEMRLHPDDCGPFVCRWRLADGLGARPDPDGVHLLAGPDLAEVLTVRLLSPTSSAANAVPAESQLEPQERVWLARRARPNGSSIRLPSELGFEVHPVRRTGGTLSAVDPERDGTGI
jgi:hypothetical protein